MSNFVLRSTRARKLFKALLGQANHLLITQLVGLEAVRIGVATCPPEFSTSWNPKSASRCAERSREFAVRSSLVATCDALDTYLRIITRHPPVLFDDNLLQDLQGYGRTHLATRLELMATHADGAPTSEVVGMLRLAVAWRNRAVHYLDEDKLNGALRDLLIGEAELIRNTFQGIDVSLMLLRFDKVSDIAGPTFKEVTGFTRAAQLYVERVDHLLLEQLDGRQYFESWLRRFVIDDDRLVRIWSRDPTTRLKRITHLAREAGFTQVEDDEGVHLVQADVAEIAAWNVVQARHELDLV